MIIAPGNPIDRTWWRDRTHAVKFMDRPEPNWWEPSAPSETRMATLRRYFCPSWKIILPFYVDDRLSLIIPDGYVMPGQIVGQRLEMCSLGERDRLVEIYKSESEEESVSWNERQDRRQRATEAYWDDFGGPHLAAANTHSGHALEQAIHVATRVQMQGDVYDAAYRAYDDNDPHSRALEAAIKAAFEAAGFEVVE